MHKGRAAAVATWNLEKQAEPYAQFTPRPPGQKACQQHDASLGRACTFDTSRNSKMPLGEDESNVSRVLLFSTNSAKKRSTAVVTSGVSAQASRHNCMTGKCVGYNQSNSSPAQQLCKMKTGFSTHPAS